MTTTVHKLNEINGAQEPAKALLMRLGYTYIPRELLVAERDGERKVLLEARLQAALLRLNPWLTPEDAERAIFQLRTVNASGIRRNQLIHEYLTFGLPLDVLQGGQRRTRTIRFFDFDHFEPNRPNELIVTTQFRVRRANEKESPKGEDDDRLVIPDLVLFVNGIPLVVMEAKSPNLIGDIWRSRAVKQLRRYQEAGAEWQGRGAPELFDYNLLCVAVSGEAAAFGAVGAGEHEYVAWKTTAPFSEEEVRDRFGGIQHGQDRLIVGLLHPRNLLTMLRDFVVYEPEKGRLVKKLPRYQQFRAVIGAMQRIVNGAKPEERGGVVWHTQGSGKSLTMLWLATELRRESRLQNPTIVVVTDRTQLDRQIGDTFVRCGFPAPERTASTKDLRAKLLARDGRTLMTTIQKFEEALNVEGGALDALNAAENVVVMVDEAHRTQYGKLAALMRKALRQATFVGFTGTPIDKGFQRSTMGRFGKLIDKYTIPESVEDGATVPIYYEAKLPDLSIEGPEKLDKLFEATFKAESEETRARLKRRYANKEALAVAERRIEQIAFDIAKHFAEKVRPNGFKAQVVAPSREAAVRYSQFLNELEEFEVASFPIITTSPNDPVIFDDARSLDQKQVISRFKDPTDRTVEVLVVVDMLLTGFDAPVDQVLYLDRGLREHALLQAIARVNRRCTVQRSGVTVEKHFGLVVDYWGVSRDLEAALAEFTHEDVAGVMEPLEDNPRQSIESAARAAEGYFPRKALTAGDLWACLRVFEADGSTDGDFKVDVYERFSADYRRFAQLLDRYLPDPEALSYVARLDLLTRIRALARATFLREDTTVDWEGLSAKVKSMIDSRIDAEVRELMQPVSILDQDFSKKIEKLPHDEARASVMEHAIRAQITERLVENPVFYDALSKQLQRIIDQMRQRLIDAAQAVRELWKLYEQAIGIAGVARQHGFTEVSFAIYELLAAVSDGTRDSTLGPSSLRERRNGYVTQPDQQLKGLSEEIEAVLARGQAIVDWQHKDDVQREMRRDIKRLLRRLGNLTEEQINELATNIVEIARGRVPR